MGKRGFNFEKEVMIKDLILSFCIIVDVFVMIKCLEILKGLKEK
jgi:hypothetical protein